MLAAIKGLPDQLIDAYGQGDRNKLPKNKEFNSIIIAGMGGSAIGADILIAYASSELKVPVMVLRDYQLPGWAEGKKSLVICSSHSGNTEETNSIFSQAVERNCTVIIITTGGKLLSAAIEKGITTWQFDYTGQPRAAVGWSFGLLLRLFSRLSLISDKEKEISDAVSSMKNLMEQIDVEVPTVKNSAKRLAGQLIDQYISIFSAEHMSPVARRWKTQINELAKAWGQFEYLPEADHNTLAGVINPADLLPKIFTVFLRSDHFFPRNIKRMDVTFTEFMVAGLCTDQIDFSAPEPLTEIWTAILFGDYVAYYLAMMYEIDPTPVDAIESLKEQME
ncbi:MAG: bifunctional phosphoglucose/phosphomannose isomerase [Pelolinea sp.]|nr:bifunctional phosphoglucose/phosphomannose isomerase [Pelolinea sp.]